MLRAVSMKVPTEKKQRSNTVTEFARKKTGSKNNQAGYIIINWQFSLLSRKVVKPA